MAKGMNDTHLGHQIRWMQWVRCLDVFEGRDAMLARRWLYLPEVTTAPNQYAEGAIWYGGYRTTVDKIVGLIVGGGVEVEEDPQWGERLEDVGRHLTIRHAAAWMASDLLVFGRTVNIVRQLGADRFIWERVEPLRFSNWEVDDEGELIAATISETDWRTFAGYGGFFDGGFGQGSALGAMVGGFGFGFGSGFGASLRKLDDDVEEQNFRAEPGMMPVVVADIEERHDRCPGAPPLIGLADLAISHWRSSADNRWALHTRAFPQPVTSGDTSNAGIEREAGPERLWNIKEGATAGLMEPRGVGFQAMETELARIAKEMATLGAQLVDEPTRHAETAEAVAMKAGGDRSLLHLVADAVEREITGLVSVEAKMRRETGPLPMVRMGRQWHQVLAPDQGEMPDGGADIA